MTAKILVVDDEPDLEDLVRQKFRRQIRDGAIAFGFARDGVEALELLAEAVPDVMLVDVEMPRMDGFDLTRNVRADARLKSVPIIMITSRTADKHRNHALEIGVNEYMGKPYQEEQLLTMIRQFTRRKSATE